MSHSSFRGVVLTLPKLRGSRLAGSGLVDAHKLGACPLMVLAKRRIVSVYTSLAKRRTVWPSTPVCSKFMPALPFWQTMIWSLSYHRLIHVPICTPLTTSLVPQSMLAQSAEVLDGSVWSRHNTKSAVSTIFRHSALFEFSSLVRISLKPDHTFRFSVLRIPKAPLLASWIG